MRFIVVDGLDGAGKDTLGLSQRYAKKGEKVVIQNHPSDSFFGKMAKKNLLKRGKVSHLKASIFLDVVYSLLRHYRRADTLIFVRYIGGVFYLPNQSREPYTAFSQPCFRPRNTCSSSKPDPRSFWRGFREGRKRRCLRTPRIFRR